MEDRNQGRETAVRSTPSLLNRRLTPRAALWFLLGAALLLGGGWQVTQAWQDAQLREAYLPELEARVRREPANGRLRTLLGARQAESGHYLAAAETLLQAIGAGEKDTPVLLTWAASLAAAGERQRAEAALQIALRDAPEPVEIKNALARVQSLPADATPQQTARAICPQGTGLLASRVAGGSFLNGLAEWQGKRHPEQSGYATRERWARAEPKNAQAQRLWSEALAKNGRWGDAEAAARRALELDPGSSASHLALADILYNGGAPSKAGLEYIAALKLRPDWLPALRGLGNVALDKKLLLIATDVFERAVKQAPNDADLWIGLGRAHYNQRINLARSLEAFQKAQSLAPKRHDYFADYSTTLRANHRDAEAEALLRKRLAADPNDAQCHFLLGLVLLDITPNPERLAEAEKSLRTSLQLRPDQVAAAAQLGRLLLDKGEAEEATQLLLSVVLQDRYNAIASKALPRALRLSGRKKEAEEAQQRWLAISDYVQREAVLNDAVRRNPLDINAYKALEKLYSSVGENEKARNQRNMIYVLKTSPKDAERGLSALVRATNLTTGATGYEEGEREKAKGERKEQETEKR